MRERITWNYRGATSQYYVYLDGEMVYNTPDRRDALLFVAQVKYSVRPEEDKG